MYLYTDYSREMKDLLHKLINISPRLRPSIEVLFASPYVKKQLQMRKLSLEDIVKVKHTFYENCIIPKKLDDWKNIISQFVNDPDLTIYVEGDSKKIEDLRIASRDAEIYHLEKKSMLKKLYDQMQKVLQEIADAKKYLMDKDILLKNIKAEIEALHYAGKQPVHSFHPKAPTISRPVNPSPRKNMHIKDIHPTPRRSDRRC